MALDDLGSGAFHPTTWPQLATCLRRLGGELCILMDNHDNLAAWVERRLGAVPDPVELALSPTDTRTYDRKDHDRLQHRVAELEGPSLPAQQTPQRQHRLAPGSRELRPGGAVEQRPRPQRSTPRGRGRADWRRAGRSQFWCAAGDALGAAAGRSTAGRLQPRDTYEGPRLQPRSHPARQPRRQGPRRGGPRAGLWPSAHPGVISWRRAAPVASAAGASSSGPEVALQAVENGRGFPGREVLTAGDGTADDG